MVSCRQQDTAPVERFDPGHDRLAPPPLPRPLDQVISEGCLHHVGQFTDAQGKFPDIEPDYPTLWLVKGHNEVPWGQRIQLN